MRSTNPTSLVCINLHTFLLPNIDPKRLFKLTNAKKTRVFIFVMCRYGYSINEQKIMEKRKNRAREWKRVYKSRGPGMLSHLWITIMPKLSELALEESSIGKNSP